MFFKTEHVKLVNKYIYERLLLVFFNKQSGILSAKPSNDHHPTSNQIEPVHLFLSLSLFLSDRTTPLDTPPPHSPKSV
jgi:hypothetical protein